MLTDESNPDLKKKIGDKMRPYLDRAEKLTTAVEYLKQQAQQVRSLFLFELLKCFVLESIFSTTDLQLLQESHPNQ